MKKLSLIIICIVWLFSGSMFAQDSVTVSVDTIQLPMMSRAYYAGVSSAADRNYNYDIHNQARYYKTMGYTLMIAGPIFTGMAFGLAGMAISESFEMPTWAEIIIPVSGLLVGLGAAIPIMIIGRDIVRKGNMIEQTAYLQVSDKVSVSSSHYANLDDRMDKGGSVGLAVKL